MNKYFLLIHTHTKKYIYICVSSHVYIALYTIKIVSKQLHINKQKNYSVSVIKSINYETNSISPVKQLYKR